MFDVLFVSDSAMFLLYDSALGIYFLPAIGCNKSDCVQYLLSAAALSIKIELMILRNLKERATIVPLKAI